MKKLKSLSLMLGAVLLIGSTTASAENEMLPVEGYTLYSYCTETGEEKYICTVCTSRIFNGERRKIRRKTGVER